MLVAAHLTLMGPAARAGEPAAANLTTHVPEAARSAALSYWTPERMRQVGADSTEQAEKTATEWPGAAPEGVGRLFSTNTPGTDTWCTATAVHSDNKDAALTAAHCLWPGYTRDNELIQVENIVFVPGYDQGQRPHGVYAARAFVLPESYTEHSSPDVAMVVFDQAGGGHLTDRAGAQRIAFDGADSSRTDIFGYPGSKAAFGESLFRCDLAVRETGSGRQWTAPCDMAGGSSGGPWFTDFDRTTGTGTIFSLTSEGTHAVDEETGEVTTTDLFGPILENAHRTLLDQAAHL